MVQNAINQSINQSINISCNQSINPLNVCSHVDVTNQSINWTKLRQKTSHVSPAIKRTLSIRFCLISRPYVQWWMTCTATTPNVVAYDASPRTPTSKRSTRSDTPHTPPPLDWQSAEADPASSLFFHRCTDETWPLGWRRYSDGTSSRKGNTTETRPHNSIPHHMLVELRPIHGWRQSSGTRKRTLLSTCNMKTTMAVNKREECGSKVSLFCIPTCLRLGWNRRVFG